MVLKENSSPDKKYEWMDKHLKCRGVFSLAGDKESITGVIANVHQIEHGSEEEKNINNK